MNGENAAVRLCQMGWVRRELPGFIGHVGPLWTRRDEAGWSYGFLLEEKHLNPARRCHGGALMTLMDHAMSTVAWEEAGRIPCVTVQFDSRFMGGAVDGEFVQVKADVIKHTGSLVFVEAKMYSGESLVMTAQAVMKKLGKTD